MGLVGHDYSATPTETAGDVWVAAMKFINRNFEVIVTPVLLVALWMVMFAFFNMNAKLEAVYTCEPVRSEEPLFPVIDIEAPEWCER